MFLSLGLHKVRSAMNHEFRHWVLLLPVSPHDATDDFLVLRQGEEQVHELEAVGGRDGVQDLGHEVPEKGSHF